MTDRTRLFSCRSHLSSYVAIYRWREAHAHRRRLGHRADKSSRRLDAEWRACCVLGCARIFGNARQEPRVQAPRRVLAMAAQGG